MTRPHKSLPGEKSKIAKINFQFLFAVALVVTGIWLWPDDVRFYAFFAFSIILYLAAAGLIYKTLTAMWELQVSRKELREMHARGNAPKNARLAGKRDLQAGGMQ